MVSIDQNRRMTSVFGRGRLRFLQNGHGFDLAGNYLGRFTVQGEPLDAHDAQGEPAGQPREGSEESVPSVEPFTVDIQPASPGQDDAPLPTTPYPDVDGDQPLAEMNIKALKALAKERGIAGGANMNKAALVEALGGDEA